MVNRVALSIGSNIDAPGNIRHAIAALGKHYGPLILSSVYESPAQGFVGANFLNLVVVLDTAESLAELLGIIRQLEDQQGRDRSAPRYASRTLDIDVLTYGEYTGCHGGITLPRAEIATRAFVLLPLAEVLPNTIHPLLQQSYCRLWEQFDKQSQRIWRLEFDWQTAMPASDLRD